MLTTKLVRMLLLLLLRPPLLREANVDAEARCRHLQFVVILLLRLLLLLVLLLLLLLLWLRRAVSHSKRQQEFLLAPQLHRASPHCCTAPIQLLPLPMAIETKPSWCECES
jgi:hypothetical protein